MGCINSKKDISDVHPNIFYVIYLNDDKTPEWSGQLEVSRTELTLHRKGKDPITWPLKYLRRYGFQNGEFTFEVGRQSITGERIYVLKCRRAETVFYTVESYIQGWFYTDENTNPNDPYPIPIATFAPSVAARSVSQNNTATRGGQQNGTGTGNNIVNRAGISTSQSLSPNGTIQSNSNQSRSTDTLPMEANYLEPTPNRPDGQPQTATTRFQQGIRLSSVSSGPASPDTTPSSPNAVTVLEVTSFNSLATNSTISGAHHGVSNLYHEFPVKNGAVGCASNATVNRMSVDIPPQETTPAAEVEATSFIKNSDLGSKPLDLPQTTDPSRMYVNVNIACPSENISKAKAKPASKSNSSLISICNNNSSFDENQYQNIKTPTSVGPNRFAQIRMNPAYQKDSARCYENVEPSELKSVIPRGRLSKPDIFSNVDLPLDNSAPCTPTATNQINYIVLDLDQANLSYIPNVPATSPTGIAPSVNNNNNLTTVNLSTTNDASPSNMQEQAAGGLLPPESPMRASTGYATIDFNKTTALRNSTTPSTELDNECLRKTRHNSTVIPLARQGNSVGD